MRLLIDAVSLSADGGTVTADHATVDRLRLISGGRLFDGHAPDAVVWPENFVAGTAHAGNFTLAATDWIVWVIYHPILAYQGGTGGWQYGSRQRWAYTTTSTPPAAWGSAPHINQDAAILTEQYGTAGTYSIYLHERLAVEFGDPLLLTRAELWIRPHAALD